MILLLIFIFIILLLSSYASTSDDKPTEKFVDAESDRKIAEIKARKGDTHLKLQTIIVISTLVLVFIFLFGNSTLMYICALTWGLCIFICSAIFLFDNTKAKEISAIQREKDFIQALRKIQMDAVNEVETFSNNHIHCIWFLERSITSLKKEEDRIKKFRTAKLLPTDPTYLNEVFVEVQQDLNRMMVELQKKKGD